MASSSCQNFLLYSSTKSLLLYYELLVVSVFEYGLLEKFTDIYLVCILKISLYIFQKEQATSGRRLYLCAGLALLAAVVFSILSSIMDKPRDSRMGNE